MTQPNESPYPQPPIVTDLPEQHPSWNGSGMPFSKPSAPDAAPPNFTAPAPAPAPEVQPPVYVKPELPPRPTALFKLDDLENERTAEPFVFEYQGEIFELMDPKDIDWQDLLVAQEQPRLMIHVIMPEEQRPRFLEMKLPMRKLEALLTRWQQHFGMTPAGEAGGSARS